MSLCFGIGKLLGRYGKSGQSRKVGVISQAVQLCRFYCYRRSLNRFFNSILTNKGGLTNTVYAALCAFVCFKAIHLWIAHDSQAFILLGGSRDCIL